MVGIKNKKTYNSRAWIGRIPIDADYFAEHLQALKQAHSGKEDKYGDPYPWWESAIEFEWQKIRESNYGSQWVSIVYTNKEGIRCRPVLRIRNEVHVGNIMPSSDEGLAQMAERAHGKYPPTLEKRERCPALQIRKWRMNVETEDDGLSIKKDSNGAPIFPDESQKSACFTSLALLNEILNAEANTKIERGERLLAHIKKLVSKGGASAQKILETFEMQNLCKGDIMLESKNFQMLLRILPYEVVEKIESILIKIPNNNICSSIQENISLKSKNIQNRGKPLSNPISRIQLNVLPSDKNKTEFYDKASSYEINGRTRYHTMDVTNDNVHEIIVPNTLVTGLVTIDALCFSQMGISIPVRGKALVLTRPVEETEDSFDLIFGEPVPSNIDSPVQANPSQNVRDEDGDEGYFSGREES